MQPWNIYWRSRRICLWNGISQLTTELTTYRCRCAGSQLFIASNDVRIRKLDARLRAICSTWVELRPCNLIQYRVVSACCIDAALKRTNALRPCERQLMDRSDDQLCPGSKCHRGGSDDARAGGSITDWPGIVKERTGPSNSQHLTVQDRQMLDHRSTF